MTSVPTISITTPEQRSMPSEIVIPDSPESPTVFDVVKELENKSFIENPEDEALDLTEDPTLAQSPTIKRKESFLIDDDEQDVNFKHKSIRKFYEGRSILITGASGFVGKALLWKLIQSLGDSFERVFVLLRRGRQHQQSAKIRFHDDILLNKAFTSLRRSMGANIFDDLIEQKIYPIFGDLTETNIGLSEADTELIKKEANIIFHCAGSIDGSENIESSVKINTLGTLQLLNFTKQFHSVSAFVHLSNLQQFGHQASHSSENCLYPLPTPVESASDILEKILKSNDTMEGQTYSDYRPLYSNAYLFSKSLAEHLLVDEVIKNKSNGNINKLPIAIMRLSSIGPSVQEPLVGWADGVNGLNGTILLIGRGSRAIQPHAGNIVADVAPVDYVVRLIIGSAANLTINDPCDTPKVAQAPPTISITTPTDEIMDKEDPNKFTRSHRRTPSQTSRMSTRNTSLFQSHLSTAQPEQSPQTMPVIYQVSTSNMRSVTWETGYETIRQYWTTATHVTLPSSSSYFNQRNSATNGLVLANSQSAGLSRARTVMNSLREYMSTPSGDSVASTSPNLSPRSSASSEKSNPSPPGSQRNSHRLSRAVDKATRLAHTTKDVMHLNFGASHNLNQNTAYLTMKIRRMEAGLEFDPTAIVPGDADFKFWVNYLTNASYGIHNFVCQEPNLRLPTPIYGWSCAIQSNHPIIEEDDASYFNYMFDRQISSSIFTQDQIVQRGARMTAHIKTLLLQSTPTAVPNEEKDDVWLTDLDDSLDDWCQDSELVHADKDKRTALGKWRRKVGSNDESVKIIVLNDKRVNQAIAQITQKAGVPKQTAVNEAMKILMRMSERTQLAFVWFAGSFLKSLLDSMFENVRVLDESLRLIRQSTIGKRVVYVPASKSILDSLLVWYVAIRYHLPVPALACDESMSCMRSISDVYRLAGAYYIKRDKTKRSPLNSAVTAAYTQVLLREHGALSFCLERSRSRTGKFQEPYPDGFIDMIVEATLQTNQTARGSANTASGGSVISRIVSSEVNTPPASPDSPSSSVASPTMSIDSLAHYSAGNSTSSMSQFKKVHKDVVFVPINITYENVPELSHLIDEVLDQQPARGRSRSASQPSSPPPSSASATPLRPIGNMVRPSVAKDRRKALLEGTGGPKKCGRVLFGVGPVVSVQDVAEEFHRQSNTSTDSESYETELVSEITKRIHNSQYKGLIVSPVSIVASIILYGRATHGVCIGKIKDLMEWLRFEIVQTGYLVDWQEGEDLDSIVLTTFKLLDDTKNFIMDGREINDDTNIRVNDHADNVMTLSYYANQMIDIFLLDSLFSIVYLSFAEESVLEDEFMDRFLFLVQLLEHEFVLSWVPEEKFALAIASYVDKKTIRQHNNRLVLLVNMENDSVRYEQLMFLASLIYPTIDAYWITSCSLSALEAVPMLPRCVVPFLTQWIATHLITGRRTIYREVLSTESSKTAVDVFMSMGFLTEIQSKEKLSPDAQSLLQELGIPTSEILIELTGQNSDGGKTPVSTVDPEAMMKAVMAQIQMNRANSNMADLCQQIDSYRLGAASQRESFQNAQVFQKCLKQIKGILKARSTLAERRNVDLVVDEDRLVQLVCSLFESSAPAGDKAAHARALRRISEAYNLR